MADPGSRDCRRCYFSQVPTVNDSFFRKAVQPYSWFSALFLFLSYIIGLWFTLRTHAALIWATEAEEKKALGMTQESSVYEPRHIVPNGPQGTPGPKGSVRDSQLYKRILGQSLKHVGLSNNNPETGEQPDKTSASENLTPHVPPRPEEDDEGHLRSNDILGLSREANESFVRQVTEVAATAATVAARDAARARKQSIPQLAARQTSRGPNDPVKILAEENDEIGISLDHTQPGGGGHDAPNWSKAKSCIVLLVATVLYAVIAEILVNTVDVVLDNVDVDEKFLGITLFALVPNTTEFLVNPPLHFSFILRTYTYTILAECHFICYEW